MVDNYLEVVYLYDLEGCKKKIYLSTVWKSEKIEGKDMKRKIIGHVVVLLAFFLPWPDSWSAT